MIGFKIDEMKGMFFDSAKVVRAVDSATRRVLSKFGAFVRQSAKTSIKKRKASTSSGSPPSSHVGLLKRFIFFGYDQAANSVVIGPIRLNKTTGEAPEALEYGGQSTAMMRRRGKRVPVRVTIKPHPFMRPARDKELPKLPAMWLDSVKP